MSRSNYSFAQVPTAEIPRSTFNRSHGHKTTFNSGYLVPFFVDEALPGDTFKASANIFARLATPLHAFMDNLWLDVFWFAVPNRLVWEHWENFMGERATPSDTTEYTVPMVDLSGLGATGVEAESLWDYLGIPIGVQFPQGEGISALYGRAYNLIFNEWFRDQNLTDPSPVPVDDGPDSASDYGLLKRAKRHDYFTSCLPWPQKGPGVELPLGTTAPVISTGNGQPTFMSGVAGPAGLRAQVGNPGPVVWQDASLGSADLEWDDTKLVADLSNATAATINSLREAFQIQKLLERDARGGTRYIEIIKSHFGVTSPDYRLQRPEFLGGGTLPVHINPVAQTSNTPASGTPQGNLAAYGVVAGGGIGFSKSFVEHSMIFGLLMVRADLSYQQGIHRMFRRQTRYDFYWPAFAHLGEQAVLNEEIFFQGTSDDALPFGYQERWAEYRYFPSKITGKFRSNYAQSLDTWHLAQDFADLPVLDNEFIEEDVPVGRVIAVQGEPEFLLDSHIKMQCTRPMPTYSVPGLIDHF